MGIWGRGGAWKRTCASCASCLALSSRRSQAVAACFNFEARCSSRAQLVAKASSSLKARRSASSLQACLSCATRAAAACSSCSSCSPSCASRQDCSASARRRTASLAAVRAKVSLRAARRCSDSRACLRIKTRYRIESRFSKVLRRRYFENLKKGLSRCFLEVSDLGKKKHHRGVFFLEKHPPGKNICA